MTAPAINTDIHTMKHRLKSHLLLCGVFFLIMPGFIFSEERVHEIKKGETVYSIARQYGVNPQDVLAYNKISDPRTVRAGTKIRIPGANSTGAGSPPVIARPEPQFPQSYDEYRVERNDTLYSLARRYGITLAELLDMNGFAPNYIIKVGEKIRVPAQKSAVAGTQGASGQSQAVSGKPPAASGQTGGAGGAVTQGNTSAPVRIDPAIRWPVKAREISYITGKLYGVQVTGERQEEVKSLTVGTVVSAGPYRGFGKVAIIQSVGYLYVYGGCETLSVKEGDIVAPGTALGRLGIDSKSAKSQLFFFVYKGNTPIDPAKAPRA